MSNSQKNLYKKLLGYLGEKKAKNFLKKQGYKILYSNYVTPYGEADIIAKKGDETVFVEVKTRTNEKFGRPCEAVDNKKQERYRRICEYYFMQNNLEIQKISFAVVEILKNQINFIENAF